MTVIIIASSKGFCLQVRSLTDFTVAVIRPTPKIGFSRRALCNTHLNCLSRKKEELDNSQLEFQPCHFALLQISGKDFGWHGVQCTFSPHSFKSC